MFSLDWQCNAKLTLEETSGSLYDVAMTKVKALEKEVAKLSRKELAAFRTWFEEFAAAAWDKQIEEDAKAGRLDKLAEEALRDFREGRCKEL